MELVNPPHERQYRVGDRPWLIRGGGPGQQLRLPAHGLSGIDMELLGQFRYHLVHLDCGQRHLGLMWIQGTELLTC